MNPEDWEPGDIIVEVYDTHTWVAILKSRSGDAWNVNSSDGVTYLSDKTITNSTNYVHISKWDLMTWRTDG